MHCCSGFCNQKNKARKSTNDTSNSDRLLSTTLVTLLIFHLLSHSFKHYHKSFKLFTLLLFITPLSPSNNHQYHHHKQRQHCHDISIMTNLTLKHNRDNYNTRLCFIRSFLGSFSWTLTTSQSLGFIITFPSTICTIFIWLLLPLVWSAHLPLWVPHSWLSSLSLWSGTGTSRHHRCPRSWWVSSRWWCRPPLACSPPGCAGPYCSRQPSRWSGTCPWWPSAMLPTEVSTRSIVS